MVFSSLTFLFVFLPLVIIFYFIIKKRKYRNIVLLLFSLLFYAWGEPKNIFLMLITIFISYVFGLIINHYENNKNIKTLFFIICLLLILSFLIYFKYFNFILYNLSRIFRFNYNIKNIIMPIGISFYTFQILSYIIDLFRGRIKVQKNIMNLALYVTLFPQLIAGPIVRYTTIEDELTNRNETLDGFVKGLKRFIIGLSKKVIIANNIAVISDFVFDLPSQNNYGMLIYWVGAIAYSLQIYYDFSGYSDMAIGLGEIFGFHFLENFDYPYISKSITEFWRRWHISLGTWFKDYIYIPLGGNRVKKTRCILNLLIVWGLTGIWHGASFNFILWGLYFGLILIVEKYLLKNVLNKINRYLLWLYSSFIIVIGWVIFRADGLYNVVSYIKKMFSFRSMNIMSLLSVNNIFIYFIFFAIGLIFVFPIKNHFLKKYENNIVYKILSDIFILLLLVLCIVFLISSKYNPFIYFRF